jgi:hypothetical protein
MIYEIRTYNFKPGAVAEWEGRFAEAYTVREKYSRLYGMWHTEIGPLNQVVHIWSYDDLQQRADIRAAAAKDPSGKWPPRGTDLLVSQETDILTPIETMTHHTNGGELGNLYELRMYTYPPGATAKVAKAFAAALKGREEIYPVAGIWTSELGNLNRLYQLFPFKDWKHRDEVRTQMRAKEVWPPHADASPMAQLVRHLIPTSFSPLR